MRRGQLAWGFLMFVSLVYLLISAARGDDDGIALSLGFAIAGGAGLVSEWQAKDVADLRGRVEALEKKP